jgi:MFS family permease
MTILAPSPTRKGLLANSAYRRLIGSLAVSRAGDFLYTTALVVVVLERTGSAGWVAAALISRLLPYAVLTPLAGVLADRVDRRRLMVLSDAARFALMLVAALVVAVDAPIWTLLLVATLTTCAGSPFTSALLASIPEVVPEDQLAPANAMISGVEYAAAVIGPLLAALVLWAGLDPLPFLLNAASFALSALLLAGIQVPRHQPDADEEEESFWRAAVGGLAVLRQERLVRVTTLVMVTMTFTYGVELVLMPLVSRDRLGTGESGLGVLDASVGIGGVLGIALAARLARSDRLLAVLGVGAIGCGIPMSLLSVVDVPVVAYALLVFEGLASITVDVTGLTALQRAVPVSKLARTDGLMASLVVAATLGGNLAGPALVRGVSLERALVAAAAVCILGGLIVLAVEFRRRLPAAEPQLADLLGDVEALQGLPQPARELLAAAASAPEELPGGALLLRQGEPADEVLVLVSGECEVLARADDGTETVINRVSGPDLLGEIGVLHERPRTATVRAASPCIVRRVTADAFLGALTPGAAPAALTASVEQRLVRWAG